MHAILRPKNIDWGEPVLDFLGCLVFLFFLSVDDGKFSLVYCSDISSVCPRQGKGSL